MDHIGELWVWRVFEKGSVGCFYLLRFVTLPQVVHVGYEEAVRVAGSVVEYVDDGNPEVLLDLAVDR